MAVAFLASVWVCGKSRRGDGPGRRRHHLRPFNGTVSTGQLVAILRSWLADLR